MRSNFSNLSSVNWLHFGVNTNPSSLNSLSTSTLEGNAVLCKNENPFHNRILMETLNSLCIIQILIASISTLLCDSDSSSN